MICQRCGAVVDLAKLKLIYKEKFLEIGHDQEDEELCDKCFKIHKREVDKIYG